MKNIFSATLSACAVACLSATMAHAQYAGGGAAPTGLGSDTVPQIYEWRIYTLAPEADAAQLDGFFRDRLIPAYSSRGIEVGAFSPAEGYTEFPDGARYLFIVWPDLETFQRVSRQVREETALLAGAKAYFDASASKPVYTRLETYLCEAFDGIPTMRQPSAERGLYEFRIYRSPNMEANERKVHMFESGEIGVFDQTGVNVVCFGRTLAGTRMPSITYLTWYKNREEREAAWKRFGAHPEWRRMSALPEYAHTATDNTVRLLTPLSYSQY